MRKNSPVKHRFGIDGVQDVPFLAEILSGEESERKGCNDLISVHSDASTVHRERKETSSPRSRAFHDMKTGRVIIARVERKAFVIAVKSLKRLDVALSGKS